MSFKTNDCQQLSLDDSFITLTERERKALEKSWAKIFADEIFPAIDEERFSVLYSDKASRPNAPVNVIIGALIIKELFDYSDDEIVENLVLDRHLQYALHKHYADLNDYNRVFCHQRNDDMEAIIQTLLADSDCLLELCKTDFEETTEYQLFVRCLSDQTVVENDKRRLRTREDGTMNSSALQNPSDPDALAD